MNKLQIKLDEVNYFDIDIGRIPFSTAGLPSDEAAKIDAAVAEYNANFDNNVVNDALVKVAYPCQCRMGEVMLRHQRRASILGDNAQPLQLSLEQEDLDAYKYGVCVLSKDGKAEKIELIVRECKNCHKIDFWGNSAVFTQLMAEAITNMESVQNDEGLPADEFAESLFGKDAYLEDIPDDDVSDAFVKNPE